MSPASRGRRAKSGKTRKSKKRSGASRGDPRRDTGSLVSPPVLPALLGPPPRRPGWFGASTEAVLGRAGLILEARGARELEQVTAELLGGEMHRVLREERVGMWFDWWFQELAEAAAARVRDDAGNGGTGWQAPWRLLHGLAAIAPPELRRFARTTMGRARRHLPPGVAGREPEWPGQLARVAATGEAWQMHDAYGARFGVIAGLGYPDEGDQSVFLFDIDACGPIDLVGGRVFDDVEQAAAAWRATVGEVAAGAEPLAADMAGTTDGLLCLVHCNAGGGSLHGTESRVVMDNWFRARRRIQDVADALTRRGTPLPEARNLYRDIDAAPMASAFAGWYRQRHGSEPGQELVEALAYEWLEGALPGTGHAASPHRAAFLRELIGDWIPDHPITVGVLALLPEWVRWHGEESGLAPALIDSAVAAAAGHSGVAPECAGVDDDLAPATGS